MDIKIEIQQLSTKANDEAKQAEELANGLEVQFGHVEAVTEALDRLQGALADAKRSADILSGLEVEPEDDIDRVLDAANTHLQACKNAHASVRDQVAILSNFA